MSKIKKIGILAVVVSLLFVTSAWAEEENRDLILDAKAGSEFAYKTSTVQYGDFTMKSNFAGTVEYPDSEKVYYDVKQGNGIFREYLVKANDYVEKGTPIMTVESTISEAQVEELRLKLLRAQENYNDYFKKYSDFLDKEEYRGKVSPGYKTEHLAVLKSKQEELEYTYQLSLLQKDIDEIAKELKEYETAYQTTQIVAPCAGIVGKLADFDTGKEIDSGCYVTEVSQIDEVCLSVNDAESLLRYGMEVEIKMNGEEQIYTGHVISPQNVTLGGNLATKKSYIAFDDKSVQPEQKAEVTVTSYPVYMEDVLLVKSSAVTEDRKGLFVSKLVNDKLEKTYIVVGKKNENYHYVLSGLKEGDVVVTD